MGSSGSGQSSDFPSLLVSQKNDQEIEDVDDGSSASNDAGNSVSFDGDGSDGVACSPCDTPE